MVPGNRSAVGPAMGTVAFAVALLVSTPVSGLVSLMEGNAPLTHAEDSAWPGLLAVWNDQSRVLYAVGPLTQQAAFYQGDTTALERVLRAFAAVTMEERVVVLLPGRGKDWPWQKKDSFYDWRLEADPGNPRVHFPEEYRQLVMPTRPTLTVFVGGAVDLERLRVPRGITLVGVDELRARCRQGLRSLHSSVRGAAAWRLARLDPYGAETAAALERLPPEEKEWSSVENALAEFRERRKDPPHVRARYAAEERGIREFVFAWRYDWLRVVVVVALVVASTLLVVTLVAATARRKRKRRELTLEADETKSEGGVRS